MFEGIEVLNGGQKVNLNNLLQNENGEYVLEGVESIKINLANGAQYNEDLRILEDGSDVSISLVDGNGNDIVIVLKGLADILLTNPGVPVFEVFVADNLLVALTTIEDLDAAAAGGGSSSSDQTADFPATAAATLGSALDSSGANVNGFGRIGIGDPEDPNLGFNVIFSGDLSGVVTEDLGQSEDGVISGQIIATDPNFDLSFVPQSTTSAFGTFTLLEDGSWTYDLDETNEDVQALNNTESLSETFTIDLAGEAGSIDLIIPINGLNDQPLVENVNLSGVFESSLVDVEDEPIFDGEETDITPLVLTQNNFSDDTITQILFTNTDFEIPNLTGLDVDNDSSLTFHLASDKLPVSNDIRVTSDALGADIQTSDVEVIIDENTGEFSVSSFKFENLAENETVTIEIDYVADDGLGFSGDLENDDITNEDSVSKIATITLTITGTNDQPILHAVTASDVLESNLNGVLSNEIISDLDTADTHEFVAEMVDATITQNVQTLVETGDGDEYEDIVSNVKVTINSDGTYTVSGDGIENLSHDEMVYITFPVRVTDNTSGLNGGESAISEPYNVTIKITGTNDQPEITDVTYGEQGSEVYESTLENVEGNEDVVFTGNFSSVTDIDSNNNSPRYKVDFSTLEVSSNNAGIDTSNVLVELNNPNARGWSRSDEFKVKSDYFDKLATDETVTITFKYKVSDWEGFRTTGDANNEPSHSEYKTVTLIVTGTNDQPVAVDDNTLAQTILVQEDFENGASGWSDNTVTETSTNASDFLGRFGGSNGNEAVYKTYSFGAVNAGKSVLITFDMLEIDSWDDEDFIVFTNGVENTSDTLAHFNKATDLSDGGDPLDNIGNSGTYWLDNDEKHTYEVFATLDENGDLKLGFGSTLNQGLNDESYGIDNIVISTGTNWTYTTFENDAITIDVLANDYDIDATDTLSIYDIDYVAQGDSTLSIVNNKLEFNPGTEFDYLPAGDSTLVTFKYRVDDNEGHGLNGDALHEPSISNWAAVTLTVIGTNDQPIVQNVILGEESPIYETHTDDVSLYTNLMDDTNSEEKNVIRATLSASDLDVGDTHKFHFDDMILGSGVNEELVMVNYDENGAVGPIIEGQIAVIFESEFVNASDVTIQRVSFLGNGANDSEVDFRLVGDFSSLADDETATITFKYFADDMTNDSNGETNLSEPKTVSITITGTNDQPVVENVVINTDENSLIEDELLNENAQLSGMLYEASDNDLSNNNFFYKIMDNSLEVQSNPVGITSSDISVVLEDADLREFNWTQSRNFDVSSDKFNSLGEGESVTFSFKYKASDWQGFRTTGDTNNEASHSEQKLVTITVEGKNDQPTITNIATTGMLYEKDLNDTISSSGTINFNDEDINDTLTIDSSYNGDLSWDGGDITTVLSPAQINDLIDAFTVTTLNSSANGGNGTWNYDTNVNLDFLNDNETITLSFEVFVKDDSFALNDTSVSQTVNITIKGTNDQPVVQNVLFGNEGSEVYESSLEDEGSNEEAKFNASLASASDDDLNGQDFHYFIFQDSISVGTNAVGITASDITVELLGAGGGGWSTQKEFNIVSPKFNSLAFGESVEVSFDYKASDWRGFLTTGDANNEPSHSEVKTVTLIISGTNDQPVVEDLVYNVYESSLADVNPKNAKFEDELSSVSDDDLTNTAPRYFILGSSLQVSSNDLGITASDISLSPSDTWSTSKDFEVLSEKFNSLGVDETLSVTFSYKASDWQGFLTTGDANNEPSHSEYKTVTLTIQGTNDQPIIQAVEYDVNEALTGNTVVNGQLNASDGDFTNTNNNEITFELIDFDPIVPSTSEAVFSVDGNVFKLLSSDVNVNDFTSKVTSLVVNTDGSYTLEGDFNELKTNEELTLVFKYQANDNEGIGELDPLHEQSLSNIEEVKITIVGTNDAPILKDIIQSRGIDENDPAFILDGLVNIEDVDDTNMESAMISISSNYQEGYDFLSIDPIYLASGVTATFDSMTGVLTLSGTASIDDYEDMLESINFEASSDNPGSTKEITWKVNDGENDSSIQTTLININEINDKPKARNNHVWLKEAGLGVLAASLVDGNLISDPNEKNGNVDSDFETELEDLIISKIKSVNEGTVDATLDSGFYEVMGEYGVLKVYPDGTYSYDLDDTLLATDALYEGQKVKDVFKYTLDDTDGKTDKAKFIVNIEGTNDAPIITMTNVETLENDEPISGIDLTSYDFTNGFTFKADIFLEGDSQTFFRQTDNQADSFLIEFGGQNFALDGQYIQIFIPTTQGVYKAESSSALSLNEWKNIEITYTPGVGAVLLIDGVNEPLTLTGIDPTVSLPAQPLNVSDPSYNVGDNNSEIFDGKFKNVELLTATDGLVYASEEANPTGDVISLTINENSPIGKLLVDIDATDVDTGDVLTYSFVDFNGNPYISDEFEIDSTTGEITVKGDLDYEVQSEYLLRVRVDDLYGGSDTEVVKITLNDISGIVSGGTGELTLVNHDFDNTTSQVNVNDLSTDDGWSITGTEQGGGNILGKFDGDEEEYVQRDFDFSGYEGQIVTIEFDFKAHGSWNESGSLQDFVTVDIDGMNEYTNSFSSGTHSISFDYLVPNTGANSVNIKINANATGGDEDWSIDNFKITTEDSKILTFDSSSEGEIDIASIISQANDFNEAASNLNELDITSGDHILSNITVSDVLSIADNNTLKISGDSGDQINLNLSDAMSEWSKDTAASMSNTTHDVYVDSATGNTVTLLIEKDVDVI